MEANPNEKKEIDNYISLIHIQSQGDEKIIVPNQKVLDCNTTSKSVSI